MKLIPAIKKDEALIAEMDVLLHGNNGFHLSWLGQSGFLLQWNGKRVLIDPYLSDSLTKKYAGTDKPHARMSELVIKPGLLKNIFNRYIKPQSYGPFRCGNVGTCPGK
jgi:hypothetical protein